MISKWARKLNIVLKETQVFNIYLIIKQLKMFKILAIRDMQIKLLWESLLPFHNTYAGKDEGKEDSSFTETGSLRKLMQPLWKSGQSFWKIRVQLPYDPAIPLLGIYLGFPMSTQHRDVCPSMFTAVVLTIARKWSQPICPSIDEWVKKKMRQ